MSQIKRVAQNTGKSKKVARKGLKAFQKSRKRMLRSIDKKRSGGWARGVKGKMRKWNFKTIGLGQMYAYGPIHATSKVNARKKIMEDFKYKPRIKLDIWEA
jgi:hypothetical protein